MSSILSILAAMILPLAASSPKSPVVIMNKGQVLAQGGLTEIDTVVVHESKNHWIAKSPSFNEYAENIFFLQLDPSIKDISWLTHLGEVIDYRQGEFALIAPINDKALSTISHFLHEFGGRCGTLQKVSNQPLVNNKSFYGPLVNEKSNKVKSVVDMATAQNVLTYVTEMTSWGTRYHRDPEGLKAGNKLAKLYEAHLPKSRSDVSINLYDHRGSSQKSVIVRIKGTTKPNEVVILGSHLDSINNRNNQDAPGADDDASGTATNLEVFRVLMENDYRPQRTIEIHAYAAEEIGLVGSDEIANAYRRNGTNVASMVQFDMNGYDSNGGKKITFVSNGTDSGLTQEMGKLVDQYVGVSWRTMPLWFGSSDHASWDQQGFSVAFPTEDTFNYNPSIHTSNDDLNQLNAVEQMGAFSKLGVAYAMTYGGL